MKKNILYLCMLSFIIFSCSNDDSSITNETPSIEESRAATIQTIANGGSKTWYIKNAELVNENGTFNITNSYNVTDDDFVFNQNGDVQWNQGNDINQYATSALDAAIDYYREPIKGTLAFIEESSDEFTLFDGLITLKLEEESILTGSINFDAGNAGAQLNITLAERTPESYPAPPSEGLNFSTITTYLSQGIFDQGAAGFIGSNSNNSLFIALRDDTGASAAEVILDYDIENNTWTENHFIQGDFVTKRFSIINNQLIVFGASITNHYTLPPDIAPYQTFPHNLYLTRFSLSSQGNLAYVTGTSLTEPDPLTPSQITSYNYLTNNISQVTTLPKSRANAGSEILNNKLYIFGGRPDINASEYDAECFIVNLENGNISTFMMNDAPKESYAARYQNLIYVGYNYFDGPVQKIKFGVYNSITDSYTNVSDNLVDGNDFEIAGITIINDYLYVVYRNIGSQEFSIQRATIN